ncbi:hypothetical protein TrST_g1302 [Triparma strigata]|uniref:Calmodulin n=1 Tax=Triparma strigata TaxID=1606541 RepID=A0A9W7EP71_9STRA|nr:hypothetical protein TrST_g1302 [Triparma strigata]
MGNKGSGGVQPTLDPASREPRSLPASSLRSSSPSASASPPFVKSSTWKDGDPPQAGEETEHLGVPRRISLPPNAKESIDKEKGKVNGEIANGKEDKISSATRPKSTYPKSPLRSSLSMLSPKNLTSSLPSNPLDGQRRKERKTPPTQLISAGLNRMFSSRGGKMEKQKMGMSTRGLQVDQQAIDFRKKHLNHEMEEKQKTVDEETKLMFKKAYERLCQGGDLSKENLRKLFGNLEEQAFEDVYCLFDWDNDGSVDVQEFVLTMSLLATPATSLDAEQDLIFAIFDVDGSGTIDREEFGKMMRATLRCKMTHLDFCMKTEDRKETFRRHLEGEYSTETLDFYNSVQEFRDLYDSLFEDEQEEAADDINELGMLIYQDFLVEGAKKEVNIPGKLRKSIEATMKGISTEEKQLIPADIFNKAQHEVYQLMNRDTFERFKNNDALMDNMLTQLYNEVDVEHNGSITVAEYKVWANKNPELTNFLKDLHETTFSGVSKAAGLEKRKQRRISEARINRDSYGVSSLMADQEGFVPPDSGRGSVGSRDNDLVSGGEVEGTVSRRGSEQKLNFSANGRRLSGASETTGVDDNAKSETPNEE